MFIRGRNAQNLPIGSEQFLQFALIADCDKLNILLSGHNGEQMISTIGNQELDDADGMYQLFHFLGFVIRKVQ